MSDSAGKRFNKKEDFEVVLSERDPGEMSSPKHSRWMTRWNKASSSAKPQVLHCSSLEDANNGICTKDFGASPFELKKSRVAERLMWERNYERPSVEHVQQVSSKAWDVGHGGWPRSKRKLIEQRDGSSQNYVMQMQKDVHSQAKAVVSETFSVHRLSKLSLDFQSQFPMLGINKNIDKIINPKRRSATGAVSNDHLVPQQTLKLSMAPSNLTAFSSQVYELQSLRITDEIMDQCKPAGGIISLLEDPACLSSGPAGKKLKVDNNSLSDLLISEQHIGHSFANPDQASASPCRCSEMKFNLPENNGKGQKVVGVSQNLKSRTPAGLHKQQDASGVVFSAPELGTEYKTEPVNYPKDSKQDDEKFYVACPLLSDKHHYRDTHRMECAANVTDSYLLLDPTPNISTVNRKGDAVTHERQPVDQFTDCIKHKGSCLFEMLTIPSKSQNAYPIDSLCSGKSSGFGVCMYGTNASSSFLGAQNQFPPERLHGDARYISSEGIVPLLRQKDNGSAEKAKPDKLATLSVKGSSGYNKENRLHSGDVNQYFSSTGTTSSKQELCTPGTEIRDFDPLPFQLRRVRNQVPNDAIRLLPCTEPTDRWLKRLRHDVADPLVPSSKRPKIRDCHPAGGTSRMSDLREGMTDADVDDHDAARSFHSWIGRWLRDGGDPALQEDPDQRKRAAATPDLASGELEGRFPSITAMAMMGRVMSKVRPFDHQRKGPWVMWKADET